MCTAKAAITTDRRHAKKKPACRNKRAFSFSEERRLVCALECDERQAATNDYSAHYDNE